MKPLGMESPDYVYFIFYQALLEPNWNYEHEAALNMADICREAIVVFEIMSGDSGFYHVRPHTADFVCQYRM